MSGYKLEKRFTIRPEKDLYGYTVGLDEDGLGCVALRSVDEDGEITSEFLIDPEALPALVEALSEMIESSE